MLLAKIKPDSRRRIFVSRAKAGARRALNEVEAIEVAMRYGFTPVLLEDLSIAEQMALFLNAEAVAGIHGAGLTGIAFAPRQCLFIEIRHTEGWSPESHKNIALEMGHPYASAPAIGSHSGTDLMIDIPAFERTLRDNL